MEHREPPEPPIPTTHTGRLTPERWQVVLFALHRFPMPFDVSAPIIAELEQQLAEQRRTAQQLQALMGGSNG